MSNGKQIHTVSSTAPEWISQSELSYTYGDFCQRIEIYQVAYSNKDNRKRYSEVSK